MSDEARFGINDEPTDELRREGEDDQVEAHRKIAVNDEPTDELRREGDDDEVEAHLKKA